MFEEEEGCSGLQTKKHKCQTARILGEDVRRLLGTAVFYVHTVFIRNFHMATNQLL